MSNPWLVISAVLALGILYVLVPRALHVFSSYRAARTLPCPETGARARVDIDAPHAALTSAFGFPKLRAKWCSLWPGRKGCGEGCLASPAAARPASREAA